MAKISALSFANNVDRNRKSLIQNCLKNGKNVSENETLDGVVAINNQISTSTPDGYFKVEFKDLNGDYFAPTQYVQAGGSATLPSEYPELDSEYLEFIGWEHNGDINNVQENILCLPNYQTKIDGTINQRPTIFKLFLTEEKLSIRLYTGNIHANSYVNWGDGTEPTKITSNTTTHTYTNGGLYTLMVYGDKYQVGGHGNYGIFYESNLNHLLLSVYIGENCDTCSLFYCYNLKTLIIPNTVNTFDGVKGCYGLKNIILPNNITSLPNDAFSQCYNLESINLPSGITRLPNSTFALCYALREIVVPSAVTSIGDTCFATMSGLKTLSIPSSTTNISTTAFNNLNGLENLILGEDFNTSLTLSSVNLSDDCLIDIANKIKDNTDLIVNVITLPKDRHFARMSTIYLNEFGARVPYGTEGAVSVLEFIQNKNWTVSFA